MQPNPPSKEQEAYYQGQPARPARAGVDPADLEAPPVPPRNYVVDPGRDSESPPTKRDLPKNNVRTVITIAAAIFGVAFGSYLVWYMLQPPADFGALPVPSNSEQDQDQDPSPPEAD